MAMHVHAVYFSPAGTTRRTVRALARALGLGTASETDWTDPAQRTRLDCGPDDLLIVGMPVYYGRIPSLFHAGLPLAGERTKWLPVVVYGNRNYDDALLELMTLGEAAGCVTLGAAAFVAQHCLNPDMGRGRPDAKDAEAVRRFAGMIRERLGHERVEPVSVPGSRPYREYRPTPFAPVLLDPKACTRCGLCVRACPVRIIEPETLEVAEPDRCLFCFGCVNACPVGARGPHPSVAPAFRAQMAALGARCTTRREAELF